MSDSGRLITSGGAKVSDRGRSESEVFMPDKGGILNHTQTDKANKCTTFQIDTDAFEDPNVHLQTKTNITELHESNRMSDHDLNQLR